MSFEEVRSQRGVRLTLSELIAGLALLVTIFTAANGWFLLPAEVRHLAQENMRQDKRIENIEQTAEARGETLARIDERTKRIEERLKQPAQDF
jgi:hypothetical protein